MSDGHINCKNNVRAVIYTIQTLAWGTPPGIVHHMDKILRLLGVRFTRDHSMPRSTAILLGCFVILTQFFDFLSTYIGVTTGAAQEANPLMLWAMQFHHWVGFGLVKVAAAILMLWLTWRRFGASLAFCGFYVAVIAWNIYVTSKGL